MRRVCLLLSCWTLIYLEPVLGSFGRTRTSEQQPRRHLEAATGDAEGEPAHRSRGAVGPLRFTRIRAGPPLIRGETTRPAPPSTWQLRDRPTSLVRRESARPWTSGRDDDVQAGTADAGAETGEQRRWQNAAPVALRGHVNQRGRNTRHRQPLVIPHDYMLSLYWSLSRGNGTTGTANTVTSLVDKGQGEVGSRDADLFLRV